MCKSTICYKSPTKINENCFLVGQSCTYNIDVNINLNCKVSILCFKFNHTYKMQITNISKIKSH